MSRQTKRDRPTDILEEAKAAAAKEIADYMEGLGEESRNLDLSSNIELS